MGSLRAEARVTDPRQRERRHSIVVNVMHGVQRPAFFYFGVGCVEDVGYADKPKEDVGG